MPSRENRFLFMYGRALGSAARPDHLRRGSWPRFHIRSGPYGSKANTIRRKVLASSPTFSRDRDSQPRAKKSWKSLWPDLDPSTALNSLNQTVYFLRRVFEPDLLRRHLARAMSDKTEKRSGSTWSSSEVRAGIVANMMRAHVARHPIRRTVSSLAQAYHGRFALDFLYEDWAADYRDSLHAAYLRIVEAIRFGPTQTPATLPVGSNCANGGGGQTPTPKACSSP